MADCGTECGYCAAMQRGEAKGHEAVFVFGPPSASQMDEFLFVPVGQLRYMPYRLAQLMKFWRGVTTAEELDIEMVGRGLIHAVELG